MSQECLYIFLDEAGNLDFSPTGTRYFILTSLAKRRPFHAYKPLTELKYDLIEAGIGLEYFHAAEDCQAVRNKVFGIITHHLDEVRLDSLIVEKKRVGSGLQPETKFYPEMLGHLLTHVFKESSFQGIGETVIVTDRIPIQRRREAVEKAVKKTLADRLPKEMRYKILHHDAKSNMDLQIVDYCNWAIYRKWNKGDLRSYAAIQGAVKSERVGP